MGTPSDDGIKWEKLPWRGGGGGADSPQLHETSVLSNLEEQLVKSQVRKVLLSCRLATPGRKPIICIDEAQVCKAWKSTKKTEFFGNNSKIIPFLSLAFTPKGRPMER